MQHSFNFGGRDQVLEAHERLLAAYGLPPATLRLAARAPRRLFYKNKS